MLDGALALDDALAGPSAAGGEMKLVTSERIVDVPAGGTLEIVQHVSLGQPSLGEQTAAGGTRGWQPSSSPSSLSSFLSLLLLGATAVLTGDRWLGYRSEGRCGWPQGQGDGPSWHARA